MTLNIRGSREEPCLTHTADREPTGAFRQSALSDVVPDPMNAPANNSAKDDDKLDGN
jgi:hypothetical protein